MPASPILLSLQPWKHFKEAPTTLLRAVFLLIATACFQAAIIFFSLVIVGSLFTPGNLTVHVLRTGLTAIIATALTFPLSTLPILFCFKWNRTGIAFISERLHFTLAHYAPFMRFGIAFSVICFLFASPGLLANFLLKSVPWGGALRPFVVLPLLIPYLIVFMRLAPAFFLLAEQPEMGADRALVASWNIMRGHVLRFFILLLCLLLIVPFFIFILKIFIFAYLGVAGKIIVGALTLLLNIWAFLAASAFYDDLPGKNAYL